MKYVDIISTNHIFEKTNFVTQQDSSGRYFDSYQCKNCGLKGKRYGTTEQLQVHGLTTQERLNNCPAAPKQEKPEYIKITRCEAYGRVFENLKPGSIHKVVPVPEKYKLIGGIWVMGIGEPVRVLPREFVASGPPESKP